MTTPYPRPYLRDGVPGLSYEDQRKALEAAKVDLSNAYEDRLSRVQCLKRDPKALKIRAEMLRPTTRKDPDMIVVASLRVLGWSMADICQALAAAAARNASVRAVDRDEVYTVETLDEVLLEALADAETARKKGQTAAGRSAGVEAAAAARRKRREKALDIARPLWALPPGEISGEAIAEKAKISIRLLHKHLGTRTDARAAVAEKAAKAERAARVASKKGKAK